MTEHELLTEALFRLRAIQSIATKDTSGRGAEADFREIARLACEGQDRVERALRDDGRRMRMVNNLGVRDR